MSFPLDGILLNHYQLFEDPRSSDAILAKFVKMVLTGLLPKTKFPREAELKEMREKLSAGPALKLLAKNATQTERLKFQICLEFVIYKNSTKITQKALAEKIGTDEALMSKILHYQIEEFTIDRLVKFLTALYPNAEVKIAITS